jgi:hypothetical protein
MQFDLRQILNDYTINGKLAAWLNLGQCGFSSQTRQQSPSSVITFQVTARCKLLSSATRGEQRSISRSVQCTLDRNTVVLLSVNLKN